MGFLGLMAALAMVGCGDDTTTTDSGVSDADADTDTDSDTDTDTDTDTDADSCASSFTLSPRGADDFELDGCVALNVAGTHAWSDDAAPDVVSYDITWSTGEPECTVQWTQTSMCGPGYYTIEAPVGELSVDLTGCGDAPEENRNSYGTSSAWAQVTTLTAGTDAGEHEGEALSSALVGSLVARVGTGFDSMEMSGTFSFVQDVTGVGHVGDRDCEVSDGDEDGDGYVDTLYGGDDCDDADADAFPGAEEILGDGIDQDCDGEDPDSPYFDDFAVGFSYYFGYSGGDPHSVYFSGSEQPALVVATFYEEDYFDAGDEAYTCQWIGEMNGFSDDDLGISDIWAGWTFSVAEYDTDCLSMDPANYGGSTPKTLFESSTQALGLDELSSSFASDLESVVGSTWETDYEPYMFAGLLGYYDKSSLSFLGIESNYALSYEIDDDDELVYDSSGYATPIELDGSGAPQGYVYVGAYYLYYADGLLY